MAVAVAVAVAACSAGEHASNAFADFARAHVTLTSSAGSHTITAWIADTPARRERGLMFVHVLPPEAGMIFFFETPRYVSMWMKNTFIALDLLFIDEGGRIVNIARDARPMSLDTIDSAAPVVAVLELPAGTAERLSLQAGDHVSYTQANH